MQCETLYNLHRKVNVLFSKKAKFCATNFRNLKNWSHNFSFLKKQEVHNWNKFYDVDCRPFHAASCGILCFLIKRI